MPVRCVVFAYHNVGVRCLRVLLAHHVEIPLVLTHEDQAGETIWFDSVAKVAAECEIACIAPLDPNAPDIVARIAALRPDFLFSFYYRHMMKRPLLALPVRGALNMHGSLLPRYRGRVPVNWAIIHGETETGATLHYMSEKADAGDVVAQSAVPILPDDTAHDVFVKVSVAAELTLYRALPMLIAGTAPRTPQDLVLGSYFGGRKPADGVIDWSSAAATVHNLVRAVAPPYPGALTRLLGRPARILRTCIIDRDRPAPPTLTPSIRATDDRITAHCGGGGTLALLAVEIDGEDVSPRALATRSGGRPLTPGL